MPGEVYCHSLTDPSILGDRAGSAHTLTYFGLHTPAALFDADPGARDMAVKRALASLDAVLDEPIADCVARDADGNPCIEAKIPQDVEKDLAMPGGHIFHGDLEWPWAPNRSRLETPAQQWGVQTAARHGAALRVGRAPRRRGLRAGRPQRRPGGAGRPLTSISPAGDERGKCSTRFTACAISSIGRAADS